MVGSTVYQGLSEAQVRGTWKAEANITCTKL
jgi:hypothetical protein